MGLWRKKVLKPWKSEQYFYLIKNFKMQFLKNGPAKSLDFNCSDLQRMSILGGYKSLSCTFFSILPSVRRTGCMKGSPLFQEAICLSGACDTRFSHNFVLPLLTAVPRAIAVWRQLCPALFPRHLPPAACACPAVGVCLSMLVSDRS